MNCPYCLAHGITVGVYQFGQMNRCPRCMRDMYCKVRTNLAGRVESHQLYRETKEAFV